MEVKWSPWQYDATVQFAQVGSQTPWPESGRLDKRTVHLLGQMRYVDEDFGWPCRVEKGKPLEEFSEPKYPIADSRMRSLPKWKEIMLTPRRYTL